ncbi:MAG: hypothetical protein WCF84_05910 [Anaerolineae bacterium]
MRNPRDTALLIRGNRLFRIVFYTAYGDMEPYLVIAPNVQSALSKAEQVADLIPSRKRHVRLIEELVGKLLA